MPAGTFALEKSILKTNKLAPWKEAEPEITDSNFSEEDFSLGTGMVPSIIRGPSFSYDVN